MSDKTPVEEYQEQKEKLAAERAKIDLDLWHQWDQGGRSPQALQPLLKRFEPAFTDKVKKWKAPNVEEAAFRSNLKRQAIKAIETYDPAHPSGAALGTFINTHLNKSLRFMKRHQNLAYTPEDKTNLFGKIQRAQDELAGTLGRDPTHADVSQHLMDFGGLNTRQRKMMSPELVQDLHRQMTTRDVMGSKFESDPIEQGSVREREVLSVLRPTLSPKEQLVFDAIFPEAKPTGWAPPSTTQLAKSLKMTAPQISRLKSEIIKKYKKHA